MYILNIYQVYIILKRKIKI